MKDKDNIKMAKGRVNYIPSPYGIFLFCMGFIGRLRKDLHSKDSDVKIEAVRFFHVRAERVEMLKMMAALLGTSPGEAREKMKGR